ncbi:MAG: hypothetical protein EPO20_30345 [Betaproteobacteria bacterium]|nr:MAG: hypothetical protein EPO20_30345 [Betaproteobacteria bacterium]
MAGFSGGCCELRRAPAAAFRGTRGRPGLRMMRGEATTPLLKVAGLTVSRLESYQFTADADLNRRYVEAEDAFHPRYLVGEAGHPPIVHPGLLLNRSSNTRSPSFRLDEDELGIHSRGEYHFKNPAYVNDRFTVCWDYAESYEKRGRPYVVIEATVIDGDRREILRWREHCTVYPRAAAGAAAPSAGDASARHAAAPAAEPPKSAAVTDVDDELVGVTLATRDRAFTLERMRLFSGPRDNIHTDPVVARASGLPAPIASATQSVGHVCDLMLEHFGMNFLSRGDVDLKMVQPIVAGDVLSYKAIVVESEATNVGTRYTLELRASNQRGELVALGRAVSPYAGGARRSPLK